MDSLNYIEMMGIMSSDHGKEPITVFLMVDAKNGNIVKAHQLTNVRTAPIVQHLGMFHEIEGRNTLDEGSHWYFAFIIIDYNGYDEN